MGLKKMIKCTKKKIKKKNKCHKKIVYNDVEISEEEELRIEDELFKRAIVEEVFLDRVEEEVDRRGGIGGLDGEAFADVLSFYLAGDPRYQQVLSRELLLSRRRKRIR
ncbi:MAG: hypothetical protein E6929_01075 [Clostridium sp.]|nr:hypothetical protein [Clostridium sp.]